MRAGGSTGACVCCSAADLTPLFRKGEYVYVACGACGCASLDPIPPDTASIYDQRYFQNSVNGGYLDYEADEELHRENARRRMELVKRLHPGEPGHLLDVGCAAGFFLQHAQSCGWSVEGVDLSSWARERAQARFGIRVQPSLADEPPSSFDVITLFQVLEHAPDPLSVLKEAHRCLRPDGALVIETWDRGSALARLFGRTWQQVTPPSVIHLFTRKSLDALLARCGFRLTGWHKTSKSVSLGFVGGLLAQKHPRLLAPVARLLQSAWLRRRSLSYWLGDLVTLSARSD